MRTCAPRAIGGSDETIGHQRRIMGMKNAGPVSHRPNERRQGIAAGEFGADTDLHRRVAALVKSAAKAAAVRTGKALGLRRTTSWRSPVPPAAGAA